MNVYLLCHFLKRYAPALLFLLMGPSFIASLPLFSNLSARADEAPSCHFIIRNAEGQPVAGPSPDHITDGLLRGALECGSDIYSLMIMTIDIDPRQHYIGVRDDPLFSQSQTGALKPIGNITISDQAEFHIHGRVDQSPRIGERRGFVHFSSLCDRVKDIDPLNCSLGTSRIKFRTTIIDTDADEVVDHSFHELSIYQAKGRLHMVSFSTPHRSHIETTTSDFIRVLRAFGLDITRRTG